MTVKELFQSVGFDNLLKALQNTHRNDRSIGTTVAYKQAFDEICLTEFEGEGGEVTFDVTSPREEWYKPHSLPLLAENVEGDYWQNTIGKTVVKPDDNPFTDAELAGAILWGMTYYGFGRHNIWSPCEDRYSSYGEKAVSLERKLYLPYLRDKHEKRRLILGQYMLFGIAFTRETWNQINFRQKHQNRSKRKRFYRMKKRIAQLKRLDKRQHLIDTLYEKCGFDDARLEEKIMNAGSIAETWRESHVADSSQRAKYLEDLLTNYSPTYNEFDFDADGLLIVAYTSEKTPLTADEESDLKSFLHSPDTNMPITFIKGIDNETKDNIALQFILIKKSLLMMTKIIDKESDTLLQ